VAEQKEYHDCCLGIGCSGMDTGCDMDPIGPNGCGFELVFCTICYAELKLDQCPDCANMKEARNAM
jgi:hypothetical protein